MRQRAVKFGVLSNPYRAVEPGEEFDYHERMNWAVPLEEPAPVAAPVAEEPPAKPTRKRKAAPEVSDDSADDII